MAVMLSLYTARELARSAGFFIARADEPGEVRVVCSHMLEVGDGASDDEIASEGIRKKLSIDGFSDELAVRALVEAHGFRYVPRQHANLC